MRFSMTVLAGVGLVLASGTVSAQTRSVYKNPFENMFFYWETRGLVPQKNKEGQIGSYADSDWQIGINVGRRHQFSVLSILTTRFSPTDPDGEQQDQFLTDDIGIRHGYRITSNRIKLHSLSLQTTYWAPASQRSVELNTSGALEFRLDYMQSLYRRKIQFHLRPIFRKYFIQNSVWSEDDPPRDYTIGSWVMLNFYPTSKIFFENLLIYQASFLARVPRPITESQENPDLAEVSPATFFLSWLGYKAFDNASVFLVYQNASSGVTRNGYETAVFDGRAAKFGLGFRASF